MSEVLFPHEKLEADVAMLLNGFTRAINALLRAAHGKESCDHHIKLLQKMRATDGVVTFNYDLVAERALKKLPFIPAFGDRPYGFGKRPESKGKVPTLYKLHGSVNWVYDEDEEHFTVRQESWGDFDDEPGYRAHSNKSLFAIMLPYWDKKIEEPPWNEIWKQAATHLKKTARLIVWGYSLPLTDLKALELLKLSLGLGRFAWRMCASSIRPRPSVRGGAQCSLDSIWPTKQSGIPGASTAVVVVLERRSYCVVRSEDGQDLAGELVLLIDTERMHL